jgi:stage II sporulation protein AA (anti-sigma F factor antagonist)
MVRSESDGEILTVYFTEAKILDELVIRQVQDELIRMLEKTQEQSVILDFRFVKFLSSSALGMLIRVNKRCKEFKIALKLCNIDKEIEKVFKITGLNKILEIHADSAEAVASLKKKGGFFFRK